LGTGQHGKEDGVNRMPQRFRLREGNHVSGLHGGQPVFPHVMKVEGPGVLFGKMLQERPLLGDETFIRLVICFQSWPLPTHSSDPFPQQTRASAAPFLTQGAIGGLIPSLPLERTIPDILRCEPKTPDAQLEGPGSFPKWDRRP